MVLGTNYRNITIVKSIQRYLCTVKMLSTKFTWIIARADSDPTSLKMGSFRRRVAILQTITSSPIGFAKRAQIHVL